MMWTIRQFLSGLAASAVLCALAADECAAAERFGDVSVGVEAAAVSRSSHGYLEHRISVANHSSTRAHEVVVQYPGKSYPGSANRIAALRRAISVGPESSVVIALPQPPLPTFAKETVMVWVDRRQSGEVPLPYSGNQWPMSASYRGLDIHYSLLLSRAINSDDFEKALSQKVYGGSPVAATSAPVHSHAPGPAQAKHDVVRSESEVTDWSGSWLAYSQFDGIVLTAAELKTMPPTVRAAIWQYVECGGTLAVLGEYEPPAGRASQVSSPVTGIRQFHSGFGVGIVCSAGSARALTRDQLNYLTILWRGTRAPWLNLKTPLAANGALPVVESLDVPLRGMFLLVLVYAILIGPINVIVLARKKKRIWMLWTVPLFSVLACFVVVFYSLFAEGVTPTIRTQTFTLLDEATHQATTIGVLAYYCPLTPADGLHFGSETELSPEVGREYGQGGEKRTVDWTKDQHLKSGWVTARAPAHFLVRKSEKRRERLQIGRDDEGAVTVLNGLGVDIEFLWVADENGAIHSGRKLGAGDRGALSAIGERCGTQDGFATLRQTVYSQDWHGSTGGSLTQRVQAVLQPGTYMATVAGNPFVNKGLMKRCHERHETTIYGLSPRNTDGN